MPGFHINEMGEIVVGAIDEIGVVDVYELASDIGKECEKIIEKFGADSVTHLMPVVINTLELLEAVTAKSERDTITIQELNEKIQKLEGDKLEKAEYRKRFEQVRMNHNIIDFVLLQIDGVKFTRTLKSNHFLMMSI